MSSSNSLQQLRRGICPLLLLLALSAASMLPTDADRPAALDSAADKSDSASGELLVPSETTIIFRPLFAYRLEQAAAQRRRDCIKKHQQLYYSQNPNEVVHGNFYYLCQNA